MCVKLGRVYKAIDVQLLLHRGGQKPKSYQTIHKHTKYAQHKHENKSLCTFSENEKMQKFCLANTLESRKTMDMAEAGSLNIDRKAAN